MSELGQSLYFDDFSPAADIVVMAACLVIFILASTSYVAKTKSFRIYVNIVVCLFLAALADVIQHNAYIHAVNGNYTLVYVFRFFYDAFLFSNLFLYIIYIIELQRLELDIRMPVITLAGVLFILLELMDLFTMVTGRGFHLDENGEKTKGISVFALGYFVLISIILYLLIRYRERIVKQVMIGFYGTITVSFLIMFNQVRQHQTSFTSASFLLPAFAMLYLVHANPYDLELGTINARALEDMVRYNHEKQSELVYSSLFLPDFDGEGKGFPKEIQSVIRRFSSEFFRGAVLFQVSNSHVILMAKKSMNTDYENKVNKLINAFYKEYEKFQFDYKIVIGETIEEISRKNEYISFINNIYRSMEMNSIHIVDENDVEQFNKYEFIIEELGDISRKRDLRDSRILAYCQPVYNIKTGKFDTAEALMRLKLKDVGVIYPDQFIPIAEEYGYIHILTEIMIQKTCDEIRHLIKENYEIQRISVNVSVLELRDSEFSSDIHKIIEESGIPEEKIAIEITESQSESDFVAMKRMINELKDKGIKFYLDDFGTGYSNMERIMELPFDIIKFDRSLVIASGSDVRARKMVTNLAAMFNELEYSVLFEGVEDEKDEERCISMFASYLQGYKYSRPIPIIELTRFFSKIS